MNPLKLLRDSFIYSLPIYPLLLLLNIPEFLLTNFLVLDLSTWFKYPFLVIAVFLANFLLGIWIWGASILYIYYYILEQRVSIARALKNTIPKIEQLILGSLMTFGVCLIGFILFIIPGIYMLVKLIFFPCAIVIENRTAKEAIHRSSNLVRGHWLSVFLAIVVNILVFSYFPIDLSSQIIVQLFPTREYAYAEMIGRILGFLVSPLSEVYNVLLFMRLRHLSSAI